MRGTHSRDDLGLRMPHQDRAVQRDADRHRADVEVAVGELLGDQAGRHRVGAEAAELLGQVDAEQSERGPSRRPVRGRARRASRASGSRAAGARARSGARSPARLSGRRSAPLGQLPESTFGPRWPSFSAHGVSRDRASRSAARCSSPVVRARIWVRFSSSIAACRLPALDVRPAAALGHPDAEGAVRGDRPRDRRARAAAAARRRPTPRRARCARPRRHRPSARSA